MPSGRKAVTHLSNELAPHRCLAAKRACENLLHAGDILAYPCLQRRANRIDCSSADHMCLFQAHCKKNSDFFQISIDKTATAYYNATNIVGWCKKYQADAA